MDQLYIFFPFLFLVAILYSSVGHGGASGYLALMAIFSFAPAVMRPTALMLNVFVSFIAFVQYYRGGYFRWKLFLPFALASVPAAFAGGYFQVDPAIYKKILGMLLLFPIIRLLADGKFDVSIEKDPVIWISVIIGLFIGFLSGLIGIGGGIILSPVILLLHWGNMKETAAVSALFIFVNSLSGLAGQFVKGINFDGMMLWMVLTAFVGGIFGSYLGANRLNLSWLKKMLAVVLIIASYKLLTT